MTPLANLVLASARRKAVLQVQLVQMLNEAIRNPKDTGHFMIVRDVPRRVIVSRSGVTLAVTERALRIMEVGKDLYDPVLYIPMADVFQKLFAVPDKTTYCPLKGHASYFAMDGGAIGIPLAWTYSRPEPFAEILADRIAFYPDEVSITEVGPAAAGQLEP